MLKYGYMNKIKLSIIIPAYNEETQLPACLKSLSKQKIDVAYEIIVVDNNSTDKTAEIAKKYGVRIIKETKRGVCSARQTGTLKAKGDIVISSDADCLFPNDWLKNIYQTFKENPQAVAVTGPFEYGKKPFWGRMYSNSLFKIVKYLYLKKNIVIHTPASNNAFRKSAWQDIGGYNTNLTQGGDEHDLLKKLKEKGKIIYLPENKIQTSSRRLKKGFVYTVFITIIYYYFLDYQVASKITGKSVTGSYPAYRSETQRHQWIYTTAYTCLLLILFLSFIFGTGKVYSKNRVVTGSRKVYSASKDSFVDINESRKNLKNHWHSYSQNLHLKEIN